MIDECGLTTQVTSAFLQQKNDKELQRIKNLSSHINDGIVKVFKGTVVNRASPFLYGGSLEISTTDPLSV